MNFSETRSPAPFGPRSNTARRLNRLHPEIVTSVTRPIRTLEGNKSAHRKRMRLHDLLQDSVYIC